MINTKQQSIVDLTWQNWDPTNKKNLARSSKESQLIASEAVEQNAKVLRLIC